MRSKPGRHGNPDLPNAAIAETDAAPGARARLERRRAPGSSAEQALALYRAIFVKSTEPIAIIDPQGQYLEQNAAHERLVGYSDDELRGRTPAIHLGEEQFRSIAEELQATGICRREGISRTKDGRTLTVELSAFAVRNGKGEPVCYVGVKRDVSDQRRATVELRQKFDELQAIYRMVDAVTRAGALDDIYGAALDELQCTLGADRASVLLYDDDGVMRFKAWRRLSDEYRGAVEGHSPWSPDDPDPQPLLVEDVEADPHLAGLMPVFSSEGIRAIGFIPLVYAGRLLGKFMIYFDSPHAVTPAELQLAQTIASHIAFAIARKRAEMENERLYREAQQANLAKSQFLARMSHELRTPLNAIGGYAELLQMGLRGPVNDAQVEDLTRIQRSQKHLLSLINDLLSFARIETGHLELRVEDVGVEQAIAGVRALIEPQLSAKGLRYEHHPGDPAVACRADRHKMRQVLANLLSNAVKFTPSDGEVTVDWESSNETVSVHVRDTGPGIPSRNLEAIFEPFVQLAPPAASVADGTGLGLAISRELARAMGGDVTVASEVGQGSTFTLTLPRAIEHR